MSTLKKSLTKKMKVGELPDFVADCIIDFVHLMYYKFIQV